MYTELFIYIGVIALLMASNTLFKIAACNITKTFDKEALFAGIKKYLFILVGVACIIAAGMLVPDMSVISVGDTQISILTMLNMVSLSVIVTYAGKAYENLKELFTLKAEQVEKYLFDINDEEEKG